MDISTEMVKELRTRTGAGVLDSKKALQDTAGNMERAATLLREKGLARAAKKADREAKEGLIEAYTHAGGRVAVMVEVNCETDFVARTPDFKALAHDLALQVAATDPRYVQAADVPAEVLEAERNAYRALMADEKKPAHVMDKIIEGKLKKFYEEKCLLSQPFIKDPNLTVADLIKQAIAKLGENIQVRRFVRYKLGE
ncbi:MAG: translation elongation factor Ts [Chloroflexi bacterium]|nr:translation elongation factor Ts [Chloroflexota bacterium]MBI3733384.1 translation elongation factor Ts [Chloroflexota bacterium]